jgi:hypothetical protein
MKMSILAICASVMMALVPLFAQAGDEPVFEREILEFETMVGVSGPFLGEDHPIRGVNGGGLPWVLEQGEGELTSDGKLEVSVNGLIIPESAGRGFNPAEFFRAAVSCLSVDADGMAIYETVFTENGAEVMVGDPTNGDARIEAKLMLPNPCIAPIVFVTSPTGSWFAVTGFEMEADEPVDADEPMDVDEPMEVAEPMPMEVAEPMPM